MANDYLVIKWKNYKTVVKEIIFNPQKTQQQSANINVNLLQNLYKDITTPLSLIKSSSPFKNLTQIISNVAPDNHVKSVATGINHLLQNGKFPSASIENYTLRYLNPYFKNVSKQMGYGSFSELYSKIKFDGLGMTSLEQKSFTEANQKASEEVLNWLRESTNTVESTKDGILVNIVTSDEETYESEVPMKRVEEGFDLTSYVYNKNIERRFTGYIADKELSIVQKINNINTAQEISDAESIKNLLVKIRDSKITFDVEIGNEKPLENCLFSSLSFTKTPDTGNGYIVNFSIVPIIKGNIETTKKKITATSSKAPRRASKGNTKNKNTNSKQNGTVQDKKSAKYDLGNAQDIDKIIRDFNNTFAPETSPILSPPPRKL